MCHPPRRASRWGTWASSTGLTWDLGDMQTLGPHPDPLNSHLHFNKMPGLPVCTGEFERAALGSWQGGVNW